LLSPAIQGLLILLIIGGIYFELQSPGIGFPLIVAIIGALLYFAPLYLDGLAAHWEILVFIAGVALLLVEIFVLPGFGVAGISGIALMIAGLSLSLIDNVAFDFSGVSLASIVRSFGFVAFFVLTALIGSIWLSSKMFTQGRLRLLTLARTQEKDEGFIGVPMEIMSLAGKEGVAFTILRPSGKIIIDGTVYDAVADTSWIEKGARVRVIKHEASQLYVMKID
jgi:membrane-bound serine protease (ClpP class)